MAKTVQNLVAPALFMALLFCVEPVAAAERFFDRYIGLAVEKLVAERAKKGYDLSRYFTQDLKYGSECCIKSNAPPLTMCVAAVSEIIIESLNLYWSETSDASPFSSLPIRSWRGSTRNDIRPHIFMYDNMGSTGTGSALRRFGIGEELKFEELKTFNFVNFDRSNGTGHAAVFLGYLSAAGDLLDSYSADVAGFKYFSAQGKGRPDAGFWYRWAYFSDASCPAAMAEKPRDCGILRSSVKAGAMWLPAHWQTGTKPRNLSRDLMVFEGRKARESTVRTLLSRALKERVPPKFTGETTD